VVVRELKLNGVVDEQMAVGRNRVDCLVVLIAEPPDVSKVLNILPCRQLGEISLKLWIHLVGGIRSE
jgi:hypothetical protein